MEGNGGVWWFDALCGFLFTLEHKYSVELLHRVSFYWFGSLSAMFFFNLHLLFRLFRSPALSKEFPVAEIANL